MRLIKVTKTTREKKVSKRKQKRLHFAEQVLCIFRKIWWCYGQFFPFLCKMFNLDSWGDLPDKLELGSSRHSMCCLLRKKCIQWISTQLLTTSFFFQKLQRKMLEPFFRLYFMASYWPWRIYIRSMHNCPVIKRQFLNPCKVMSLKPFFQIPIIILQS